MGGLLAFGQYLLGNGSHILFLTGQHAYLSLLGVVLGTMTAVPLGIFISRRPKLSVYVIDAAGMLYTIPSLALLGLMLPYLGFGWLPVILSLVIYSLLPVLRNTVAGIINVDPAAREAAQGMGATNFQMLWRVELPMAFPVIMSGIRTVAVLTVGTTTMAALVGAGGLGELVFQGISMMDNRLTMAGAIPIAMMAVILDQCLGLIERRLQKLTGVVDQVV